MFWNSHKAEEEPLPQEEVAMPVDDADDVDEVVQEEEEQQHEEYEERQEEERTEDPQEPSSAWSSASLPKAADNEKEYDFCQRISVRVAHRPCTYFWISFLVSLGLGVVGMTVGDFAVEADNAGWNSRGTEIANRHTQFMLIEDNQYALWNPSTSEATWLDLINNVQDGWEMDDDSDGRRRLQATAPAQQEAIGFSDLSELGHRVQRGLQARPWKMPPNDDNHPTSTRKARRLAPRLQRRLQESTNETGGILEGCDTSWYTSYNSLLGSTHLWPVWKLKTSSSSPSSSDSFLDASLLEQLCLQEQVTLEALVQSNLCFGCQSPDRCLQPYSPVLWARLVVSDGMQLDCAALAQAWGESHQSDMEEALVSCVSDIKGNYNPERDGGDLPESCPNGFFPTVLDEYYDETNTRVQYTSSIFATRSNDVDELFDKVNDFGSSTESFDAAYDTQYEDFVNLELDNQLLIDMSLAVGSAVITTAAIVVHTRSPFLSLIGLLQIVLSFPLSFFFYTFVAQLDFFPFLCFIGIFVIFALGADDVFVAVDKWKNARLARPASTPTAVIAAHALPDAAMAMLLTTATTAVAFLARPCVPSPPFDALPSFACGLLVVFDYLLCVLLVFPALCIYDAKRHVANCCCRCHWCCRRGRNSTDGSGEEEEDDDDGLDATPSLIRRILTTFYNFLHKVRWVLLLCCAGALVVSAIYAASIELPTSSDVRLYDENDNQFEQNFVWRQKLLFEALLKLGGSSAFVIWGVKPGDTGDLNNPSEWSQLLVDDTFEPSREDVQGYLLGFCDRLFDNDFAALVEDDYVCPINKFDTWLSEQSTSDSPETAYSENCGGADGLPMAPEQFDACIYAWGQAYRETTILTRDGKVEVMFVKFNSRVRYDSPYDDLDREWNSIDDWLKGDNAPYGAHRAFFTSEDFWWYDTNGQMLQTAYTSAGIALGAAAAIILFSSRSLVLTIFSTVTVGFVLTTVTATLVALGWTLGFLESILFAILIGISCDFVIHFSHAYASLKGHTPRSERTKFALISMGPSILAAGFTTFAAAVVMLFTVITFFEKFAVILFLTVLQALVGSFIVFLTLTDCIGPEDPTYLMDRILAKCCKCFGREHAMQGEHKTEHFGMTDSGLATDS